MVTYNSADVIEVVWRQDRRRGQTTIVWVDTVFSNGHRQCVAAFSNCHDRNDAELWFAAANVDFTAEDVVLILIGRRPAHCNCEEPSGCPSRGSRRCRRQAYPAARRTSRFRLSAVRHLPGLAFQQLGFESSLAHKSGKPEISVPCARNDGRHRPARRRLPDDNQTTRPGGYRRFRRGFLPNLVRGCRFL